MNIFNHKLICKYCNKEFERSNLYIQKHHPLHCSRACHANAHNNILICDQCGINFKRNIAQTKKYAKHFCSKKCKSLSQDGVEIWGGSRNLTDSQLLLLRAKKTPEHKAEISKSHLGMRPTEETRKKLRESARGKIITENHKMNMRLAFQKRIEKQKNDTIKFSPRIGLQEKRIIDIFQKYLYYPIIRQHRVNGYFIDGYCPVLNLSIEIDEPIHFKDGVDATQLKDKDILRQQYLENILKCKFIRIPVGYS